MAARIDPHWRYHDLSAIVLETLVGLDLPSVHPTDYRRVHAILFRGNVAVIEGLVRLGEVRASRRPGRLAGPGAGDPGRPVRPVTRGPRRALSDRVPP